MIDINISKVCKSFGFDLVLNNIDITVQKGEKVGIMGSTGRSTGPHLHFDLTKNGSRVNPLDYLYVYSGQIVNSGSKGLVRYI